MNLKAQLSSDSLEIYYSQNAYTKVVNHANLNIEEYSNLKDTLNISYYFKSLDSLIFKSLKYEQKDKVEFFYNESKTNYEKVFGANNLRLANSLNDFGLYYLNLKDYLKAGQLFINALEVTESFDSKISVLKGTIMNNLGFLCQEQGHYIKSESLLKQSLNISKNLSPNDYEQYMFRLSDLATTYFNLNKYTLAESSYIELINIKEKIVPEYDSKYFKYLNSLGYLYYLQEKYIEAENTYNKVLELSKKYPEGNKQFSETTLNTLAYIYYIQGKYLEAKPLYLDLLGLIKTRGESNGAYYSLISKLAAVHRNLGEFSKAEVYYLRNVEYAKTHFGETHENYAISLGNLGLFYSDQSKYIEAEKLYLEALGILKYSVGEKNISTAQIIANLGLIYQSTGRVIESEKLFLKALEFEKSLRGENTVSYAKFSRNLAETYYQLKEYHKAEMLLLESLEIKKNTVGEMSNTYGISLQALSKFYQNIGSYDKALKLMQEAFEIYKNTFGTESIPYLNSLNSLGAAYFFADNYEMAEELWLEGLEIMNSEFDENDELYGDFLNRLGVIYQNQKKYDESEKILRKAMIFREIKFGENSYAYANSIFNLAMTLHKNDKLIESENLYLKSLELIRKTVGENSDIYNYNLLLLSRLYYDTDNLQKGQFYINRTFEIFKGKIIDVSSFTNSEELALYKLKYQNNILVPLEYLNKFTNQNKYINIGAFENEILVKNLSLKNFQIIKDRIKSELNEELSEKYQRYIENKKYIFKLENQSILSRTKDYEVIINENFKLEKEITNLAKSNLSLEDEFAVSWEDLFKKLKPDEAIINFVDVSYGDKLENIDYKIFSAFLVNKEFDFPVYKSLFTNSEITDLNEMKSSSEIDSLYSSFILRNFYLEPFLGSLNNIKTLYIIPSSLGHQINFSAIPISDSKTLGGKYEVHILGSSAALLESKDLVIDKNDDLMLLLYGDIDFDNAETNPNAFINDIINPKAKDDLYAMRSGSGIVKWSYLSGSENEINIIKANSDSFGFKSQIINGKQATKSSILKLDGETDNYILHLATHGFFFENLKTDLSVKQGFPINYENQGLTKASFYKASEDPMLRSGLVFAGVNNYWGKPIESSVIDDGILTAKEISNLDLSACQLVVLSACETGLGDINGSEGVFGLQRAFKMAGVKNIIMSLWKVPDAQTAELFEIFYGYCFTGKSIHEALRMAQADMKKKYSPYYWAGFVLLE
ncbi:CHAT domain-containing protein [Lacinutrix sp. MEBiC02404]